MPRKPNLTDAECGVYTVVYTLYMGGRGGPGLGSFPAARAAGCAGRGTGIKLTNRGVGA